MTEQEKIFWQTCQEIQSKCCCRSLDARDCIRFRYPLPCDDIKRFEEEQRLEDPDEWCECACHAEIAEEEASQEWPL